MIFLPSLSLFSIMWRVCSFLHTSNPKKQIFHFVAINQTVTKLMMVGLKNSNGYCLENFGTKIIQLFRNSKFVENSPKELAAIQNKTRSRPVTDVVEIRGLHGVFEKGEITNLAISKFRGSHFGRHRSLVKFFFLCSLACFAVFSVQTSAGAAIARSQNSTDKTARL